MQTCRPLAAFATALAAISCAGFEPGSGAGFTTMHIVFTAGDSNTPSNNFAVLVDGTTRIDLPVGAKGIIDTIVTGTHTVTFISTVSGCTSDAAFRTLSLAPGGSATVTFAVSCPNRFVRQINVVVNSTGSDIPSTDYLLPIQENGATPVHSNGNTTVSVVAGVYPAPLLAGLPANCAMTTTHPTGSIQQAGGWAIDIPPTASFSLTLTFDVMCHAR